VQFHGTGEVHVPSEVECRLEGLDREYEQAIAEKKIPPTFDRIEFKWARIRMEPDKYLTPLKEMLLDTQKTYAWGTAFAISGEGILLTNRHVVESEKPKPLDGKIINYYSPKPFKRMIGTLMTTVGKPPADPDTLFVTVMSLLDWFGKHSWQTSKFPRGEILLSFSRQKHNLFDTTQRVDQLVTKLVDEMTSEMFGFDTRKSAVAPIKVIAMGGEKPHEDVAILQLDASAKDALVCLPLAADGLAKKDMPICSLGFPDWRYNLETMHPLELLQVNESRGTITLLPYSDHSGVGDWSRAENRKIREAGAEGLLLLSAKMWHGVSGGPVVTENGIVVGLNVGGNEIPIPAELQTKYLFLPNQTKYVNNFAVPIAAAKKLLAENRITPDLGKSTEIWNEGLNSYRLGRYTEANGKFRQVAERQHIALAVPDKPQGEIKKPWEAGGLTAKKNVVNQYVQEMIDLSQAKMTAERN
jgi:S1-C subfamily serine protease